MVVEELRPLIIEGPGADRVLRLAAAEAKVPAEQVDELIDSASLRAEPAGMGLPCPACSAATSWTATSPRWADDPVKLMVGALGLSQQVTPGGDGEGGAGRHVRRRPAAGWRTPPRPPWR